MADGADPETSTVSDYMTTRPITADVDEDSKDRVVGIISIRDLAVLEAWEPGTQTQMPA
jgi:hypothetical protein